MCGLCGLLGLTHWSETAAHPDAFTGDRRRTLRAERAHRVALVNAVLAPARLTLQDFQASSYILRTATGRSEIVEDIQGVWAAVERLTGQPIDPLDFVWCAAMARQA